MKDNVYCVHFVSRNKDNANIENFKPRQKLFLTEGATITEAITNDFFNFVKEGVDGESCRMYISVNSRDMEKAKKKLLCRMIEDDNFDLLHFNNAIISCAMQADCAVTKKWHFDFDNSSLEALKEFKQDIQANCDAPIAAYSTPNGWAVIVDHGFDTRALMEKWGSCCELKRDSFRFIMKKTKEKEK